MTRNRVLKSPVRDLRSMRISLCFASRFSTLGWSVQSARLTTLYSVILPLGYSGGQQRSEPWRYLKIRSRGQNEICAGHTTGYRPRLFKNVQTAVSSHVLTTFVVHVVTTATKKSSRWPTKSISTKTQHKIALHTVGGIFADSYRYK